MLLGGQVRDRIRDRVQVYCSVYSAPDPDHLFDQTTERHETCGYTAFKLGPDRRDLHSGRSVSSSGKSVTGSAGSGTLAHSHVEFAFDAHAKILEPYKALHSPPGGHNRFTFLALLPARGADLIQPDICTVGSVGEMRRIATLAEAHDVTVAPHDPMGPPATAVPIHVAAARPNFQILDFKPSAECPGHGIPIGGRSTGIGCCVRPSRPRGVEIDRRCWTGTMTCTNDDTHWQRKAARKPDGQTAYPRRRHL